MNGWRFCIVDPQDAALELCGGSMDKGDGYGGGYGYGDGYGDLNGYGYGDGWGDLGCGDGDGWGDGDGDGWGDGTSPKEWK